MKISKISWPTQHVSWLATQPCYQVFRVASSTGVVDQTNVMGVGQGSAYTQPSKSELSGIPRQLPTWKGGEWIAPIACGEVPVRNMNSE